MRLTPVLCFLFFALNTFSQGYSFNWAKATGSSYDENDQHVLAIDDDNNSYVAGHFYNSDFDFDPSSGTYTLNNATGYGYLAKYDSTGALVWAKNFGPGNSSTLTVMFEAFDLKFDNNNDLVLAGTFSGGGDFDPSTATHTMEFNGSYYLGAPYIAKFNKSGALLAAEVIGTSMTVTPMTGWGDARSIAFDAANNIIVTGNLGGTLDFDPSPSATVAVTNSLIGSYTGDGSYLAKYSSTLGLLWAENLGVDNPRSLDLNSSGDIFIVGTFKSVRDFDPSSSTFTLSAYGSTQDIFLSKFDSNGGFSYAISMGTEGTDNGNSIVVDNSSNVYITGAFPNAMDFDPVGTNVLTVIGGTNWAAPTTDIYVAKYTPSLTLIWARNEGGASYDSGSKIVLDKNSNVLVAGNFGFMGANYYLYSGGIIVKYSPAGNLEWRAPYTGWNNTNGNSIAIDTAARNVFVVGTFRSETDFDPNGLNTYTLNSNSNSVDAYLMRLSPCTAPSISAVSQSTNNICQGAEVTLSVSGQLNGSEYWTWSKGSCTSPTIGVYESIMVTPTVTTVYYVRGTGGCNAPTMTCSSVTVNVLPQPTVAFSLPAPACWDATVTVGASGASSYTWSTGSNASTCVVTVTPNTQVTLSATASNGCTLSSVAQVSMLPYNFITISPTNNVFCYGTSAVLTASGASNYSWSTGSTQSTIAVTATASGQYSVSGIDQNGCASAGYYYFNSYPLPNITVSGPTLVCLGQTVSLTASGAASYTWNGVNTGTTIVISPSAGVVYTITGDGPHGCINTRTFAVSVGTVPVISVSPSSVSICLGAIATLTASGTNSFSWPNSQAGNTATFSPTISSAISVTGTASSNGCSVTQTAYINVMPLPTLAISGTSSLCAGSSATLTASGANYYTWINGPNTSVYVVTPSSSAVFTVAGPGSNGCIATTVFSITVHALPQLTVNQSSFVLCPGVPVTFTVNGAPSYSWSTGSTASIVSFIPPSTGIYSVTGTSAAGCSSNATVGISVNPLPQLSVVPSTVTVCALTPVSFTASGADIYLWNSTQVGAVQTFSPGVFTVYYVVGTNTTTGCSATSYMSVITNSLPPLTVSGGTSQCAFLTATISASGASSYLWSNGANVAATTVSPGVSTIYTVTGTGLNGCAASETVGITVFDLPQLAVSPASASICSGSSIMHQATGAQSYSWSLGTTSDTVLTTPATSTVYFVIGTGSNGCVATVSVPVTVNPNPQVNVTPANATLCAGTTGTFTASGANTYSWSNGFIGNSLLIAPSTNTVINLMGVDVYGCAGFNSITIFMKPAPQLLITPSSATVCAGELLMLNVTGASTYTWNESLSNDSTVYIQVMSDTVVTVTGAGSNLCLASQNLSIAADLCTGLRGFDSENIVIYPSPFTDLLFIDGVKGTFLVQVYNNLGAVVHREYVSSNYVNLQSLPKGIYYLRIGSSQSSGYKVVKD